MQTDTETDWVTYTLDEADRLAERQTARDQAQQTTPEPEGVYLERPAYDAVGEQIFCGFAVVIGFLLWWAAMVLA
jgi:uncharacterized membrane protein YphA (DoxX/SURF4 family)